MVPVPTPRSPEARRTQAERSAATTAKLLEAAVEAIVELGWSGTSTNEVCRRAGVSRGALLHHYPTKAELIRAAVDHLMDRRIEEFRVTLSTLPPGTDVLTRLETAIDVLWGIFQSPIVDAWLELVMAARTDDQLRPIVRVTGARLDADIQATWRELFPPDDALPAGFYDLAPAYLFALLDGLAVQRLAGAPDAEARAATTILTTKLIVRTLASTDPAVLADHLGRLLGPPPTADPPPRPGRASRRRAVRSQPTTRKELDTP